MESSCLASLPWGTGSGPWIGGCVVSRSSRVLHPPWTSEPGISHSALPSTLTLPPPSASCSPAVFPFPGLLGDEDTSGFRANQTAAPEEARDGAAGSSPEPGIGVTSAGAAACCWGGAGPLEEPAPAQLAQRMRLLLYSSGSTVLRGGPDPKTHLKAHRQALLFPRSSSARQVFVLASP